MQTEEQVVRVNARTILGDDERTLDVPGATLTGEVATAAADAFMLPDNVPWALRDERGWFLDDAAAIGTHAEPGQALNATLTPKAHLG